MKISVPSFHREFGVGFKMETYLAKLTFARGCRISTSFII